MGFLYTAGCLANIKAAISDDRFNTYLDACSGDERAAIDLYLWNVGVCGRLYGPLHAVEVTLRNAFHTQLEKLFGTADWMHDGAFVKIADDVAHPAVVPKRPPPDLVHEIKTTEQRLQNDLNYKSSRGLTTKTALVPGDIVAGLSFGFWTQMLNNSFEPSLWSPALQHAFPNFRALRHTPLTRAEIAKHFDWIKRTRNRMAHHEPMIKIDVKRAYESLLATCAWMTSDVDKWIHHHSTLYDHVQSRNAPRHRI